MIDDEFEAEDNLDARLERLDNEFEAITPYIINFIEAEDNLDARLERLDKLRQYIAHYVPGEYE
jgi:hypothetical protein